MIARLLATLIALAPLAACAAPAPAPAPVAAAPRVGAGAPAPTFALLADPQALIAALPPALADADVSAPPAPADPAALESRGAPLLRWRDAAATAARLDGADEAAVAAELRAVDLALNDGLALAALARSQGVDVADDALLADLAWRLIAQAHPLRADAARADAELAAWVGFWRGDASAPAVVTGRMLGAAAAPAIADAWGAARETPAAQQGGGGK